MQTSAVLLLRGISRLAMWRSGSCSHDGGGKFAMCFATSDSGNCTEQALTGSGVKVGGVDDEAQSVHVAGDEVGKDNEEVQRMKKVNAVLKAAGLGPKTLEKMKVRKDITEAKIAERILWLRDMGCDMGDAGSIIRRYPKSATASVETMSTKVEYLMKELNITKAEFLTVAKKFPGILTKSIKKLSTTCTIFKEMGASPGQISKIVTQCPTLFGLENTSRCIGLTEIIQDRCNVSGEELLRIFVRHPRVLTFSLEKVAQNIDYLIALGMPPKRVLSLKCSALWGRSIENAIVPCLEWLRERGLDNEQIVAVLAVEPLVLAYSREKLDRNYQVLTDLSLSKEQIAKIYIRSPKIFGLNLCTPNNRSKMEFIKKNMNSDVGAYLAKCPQILNLSLKKRIAPRFAYLSLNGATINIKALTVSDTNFCLNIVKKPEEEYLEFLSSWPS